MYEHVDRTTFGSDANDARCFCFTRCIRWNRKRLSIMAAEELKGLARRRPAGTVRERNPVTRACKAEGYTSPKPAGAAGNEREPSQINAAPPLDARDFLALNS